MMQVFLVIFGLMFCSVFLWFYLCHRLFSTLKTNHPEKFEAMGRPALFTNNNVSNNFSLLKFLWRKEWVEFRDPEIMSIGQKMRVFGFVYSLVLLGMMVGMPLMLE